MSLNSWTEKIDLLRTQQQQLFEQAIDWLLPDEPSETILDELCAKVARMLACDRVSIWLFDESGNEMSLKTSFQRETLSSFSFQTRYYRDNCPSYFQTFEQDRTLAIRNMIAHPAAKEFVQMYEDGYPLQSMVQAPIMMSIGIGGLICCESISERKWDTIDETLLASIADLLGVICDRLFQQNIQRYVHQLAFTDRLTGLDNHFSFTEKVTRLLRRSKNEQKGVFIYIVLDQFTQVQGVLGRDVSDQLLKIVGRRLQSHCYKEARIGRIAFDHFIVFLPYDQTDREIESVVYKKMEKIEEALKKPIFIVGQEVYITFSYGFSLLPQHATTVKTGIQTAYLALESQRKSVPRKAKGMYHPTMHSHLKESLLSEMNLRRGLDFNEFQLFYQPQVDCVTGRLTGFEALLRWDHPEKGLIFPGEFIDLAESTGLIIPIGEWVLKKAMKQLRIWHEKGFRHLTLSINISPRHFLHSKFPSYLQHCLEETCVSPNYIVLEITENVALENQSFVEKRILDLRKMGFNISIDDFGKGYSAFIYLQHFSIHQVKIDREFIVGLESNSKSRLIVQSIVNLAKTLNLKTVGEGIETKEQWKLLQDCGCTKLQGYYFARPISLEQVNQLLLHYDQNFQVKLPISSLRAAQF